MSRELTIDRLGRQGDGIADTESGPVYLPFTLPGERVAVSGTRPKLEAILAPSPERREPVCRHFGTCGGCQMQHLAPEPYREWKRGLLIDALAREGIATAIDPLVTFPTASRRRAVFTAARSGKGVSFGFLMRDSPNLVDIAQCPVLAPALAVKLDALRGLANVLAPSRGVLKLAVLACDNGLDVALSLPGRPPQRQADRALALAGQAGLARLSVNGEIIAEFRRPVLACGMAFVSPPPDAFAQAVAGAEAAMAVLATGHLAGCKRVADLFCGFGAFALRLAERSEVLAADSDAASIAALERAWRETGGRLKRLTAEKRDLFRRPLTAAEMKAFDGVLFDPPRAGAEEQARQIAASKVGRVVAISCNPVTLARDLRILLDGGYRLTSITPIDQFAFTPHVEAVALLERQG